MTPNTRRLHAARARIRAAVTLLRDARGLDSMDAETQESCRQDAILLESVAATVSLHITATDAHMEKMARSRKR